MTNFRFKFLLCTFFISFVFSAFLILYTFINKSTVDTDSKILLEVLNFEKKTSLKLYSLSQQTNEIVSKLNKISDIEKKVNFKQEKCTISDARLFDAILSTFKVKIFFYDGGDIQLLLDDLESHLYPIVDSTIVELVKSVKTVDLKNIRELHSLRVLTKKYFKSMCKKQISELKFKDLGVFTLEKRVKLKECTLLDSEFVDMGNYKKLLDSKILANDEFEDLRRILKDTLLLQKNVDKIYFRLIYIRKRLGD